MKKIRNAAIIILAVLLAGFIYFYVTLPAINIHSAGFWTFIFILIAALTGIYAVVKIRAVEDLKTDKGIKAGIILFAAVVVSYIIGAVLSSPIVNAAKYQRLLTVEERKFSEDIKEVNYNQIPLLDKNSAELLGNRKMGSMVDMVSQFEVSSLYTQINHQGMPVRVSPLEYANGIKWLTNQKEGIPAYIKIDMATQNTECIKLDKGIKYSESEFFNRNIYRHLRFRYPTYIFDVLSFEIDEAGVPYWICPVKKFNIGLFGGETVGRVVLCNAQTGETVDYALEEVPVWVDRAHSADMLVRLYDYYGMYKHGYFNSILGQKDCLQTTNGYNYIALDDDVWVYTGITSVSGDQSNVGFVLINQRTMETRFYSVEGATEESAMASAEGQVQNLGYRASFPLLLNIAGEPTYFIALKDNGGLVKKYAMVNVQKYQWVAIGDTVGECEKAYISLLNTNGISGTEDGSLLSITGKIKNIAPIVLDGNTHYYIYLDQSEDIFDVDFTNKENLKIVKYVAGDEITFEYAQGSESNTVLRIK